MNNAPRIYVLAGTNGAGKSSLGGAMLQTYGASFFNPDTFTQELRLQFPELELEQANSISWRQGVKLLDAAIEGSYDFAFETTLGGHTISSMLADAAGRGIEVRIWYVGLESPELHLARVKARVARGGHDIPEAKVRARYDSSRLNLIALLPEVTELRLFDNSSDGDPYAGNAPGPMLVLHFARNAIVFRCEASQTPTWCEPIVKAAISLAQAMS